MSDEKSKKRRKDDADEKDRKKTKKLKLDKSANSSVNGTPLPAIKKMSTSAVPLPKPLSSESYAVSAPAAPSPGTPSYNTNPVRVRVPVLLRPTKLTSQRPLRPLHPKYRYRHH
jgi:hypothetical protein